MIETKSTRIWGQLLPQGNELTESLPLHQENHIVGRIGDLKINDPNISGVHCIIRYDKQMNKAYLIDFSNKGTFIFDKKLTKEQETHLNHGDIIYLLKDKQERIGFVFNALFHKSQNDLDIPDDQKQALLKKEKNKKKEQTQQLLKTHDELQQKLKKIQEEDEAFEKDQTCVICVNLLYNPYVMTPCLHTYCCDCMIELIKQKDFVCPQCRLKPESIQKNYPLNNMITNFLKKYPEKRWSEETVKRKEEINNKNKEQVSQFNKKLQVKKVKQILTNNQVSRREFDLSLEYSSDDQVEVSDNVNRESNISNSYFLAPVSPLELSTLQLLLLFIVVTFISYQNTIITTCLNYKLSFY